jgi:voltage-gated potassium channel Kch
VEHHHPTLSSALESGLTAVWGNVDSEDVLRAAGIAQARMLIMAVPGWKDIHLGIQRANLLNPRLFVVARAAGPTHVQSLRDLGVTAIVQPEFEGGVEMVRRVLAQYERSDEEIAHLTSSLRRALYEPGG